MILSQIQCRGHVTFRCLNEYEFEDRLDVDEQDITTTRRAIIWSLHRHLYHRKLKPTDYFVAGVECLVKEHAPETRNGRFIEKVRTTDLKWFWHRYTDFLEAIEEEDMLSRELFVTKSFREASRRAEDADFPSYVDDINMYIEKYDRIVQGRKTSPSNEDHRDQSYTNTRSS